MRPSTTKTTTTTPPPPPVTAKNYYFDNPFHNRFQKTYEPTTRAPYYSSWSTSSRSTFSTKFAFNKSTTTRNPYEWSQYYKAKTAAAAPAPEPYDNVAVVSQTPSTERTTRAPYANIRPSTYNSVFDVYFNQIKAYNSKNNL